MVSPLRGKRGEATQNKGALNRPRAGKGNYVKSYYVIYENNYADFHICAEQQLSPGLLTHHSGLRHQVLWDHSLLPPKTAELGTWLYISSCHCSSHNHDTGTCSYQHMHFGSQKKKTAESGLCVLVACLPLEALQSISTKKDRNANALLLARYIKWFSLSL